VGGRFAAGLRFARERALARRWPLRSG